MCQKVHIDFIGTKLPPALGDSFRAACKRRGVSVSAELRRLMRQSIIEASTQSEREAREGIALSDKAGGA